MPQRLLPLAAAAALGLAALSLPGAAPAQDASRPPNKILTQNGLHWHVHIQIYVNGVRQTIPANIGIGPGYSKKPEYIAAMQMTGIHTHSADGEIHLEFPGTVRNRDLTLGDFFAIWGKTPADFGKTLIMKVNGKTSEQGMNYVFRDGDKIILSFFP